jgi:lysophospholipid hydrolase
MISIIPSAVALANTTAMEHPAVRRSWVGMFGRMTLFLIPGVLYWLITFATITLPTFLFTLFSTSLTFTMNATTL